MSRPVVFWYWRISLSATVPGRYRCGFIVRGTPGDATRFDAGRLPEATDALPAGRRFTPPGWFDRSAADGVLFVRAMMMMSL
jgi:hypothetical protein